MPEWLRQWGERRTLRRRAIPDALWQSTLERFPFLGMRSQPEVDELRDMATLFLAKKEFTGAHGLDVDDSMAVAIAAQACVPVLKLGLSWYDGFVGIVVHAEAVVARREFMDEDGVVHEYTEELTGEAMLGGPVMLSWSDVEEAGESAREAYNVVIHEFVHVLDMRDGVADGTPALADLAAQEHWREVLGREYGDFRRQVDTHRHTMLDPYAAEAPEEFFAIASEAFFVAPREFRLEHPRMYELLKGFFRQDPAEQAS